MSETTSQNNFEKYEKLYIRICYSQTNEYIKCLHDKYEIGISCEELRNKYLSCIYYNENDNMNENDNVNKKDKILTNNI